MLVCINHGDNIQLFELCDKKDDLWGLAYQAEALNSNPHTTAKKKKKKKTPKGEKKRMSCEISRAVQNSFCCKHYWDMNEDSGHTLS
jgi:hypothetical protein